MTIHLHDHDLPSSFNSGTAVAMDTEAMGLHLNRDRLCLIQVSNGDGTAHLVKIDPTPKSAPVLTKILSDPKCQKIFHYARFDVAHLVNAFKCELPNIYCTKIASKLARTYTPRHGLKDLCAELLNIQLDKTCQTSYWAADPLTDSQKAYAAQDVLYLHQLRDILNERLTELNRKALAEKLFQTVEALALTELAGFLPEFVLSHE